MSNLLHSRQVIILIYCSITSGYFTEPKQLVKCKALNLCSFCSTFRHLTRVSGLAVAKPTKISKLRVFGRCVAQLGSALRWG